MYPMKKSLLVLFALTLASCAPTTTPTLYHSAEEIRTDSPSLYRHTYKALLKLSQNEPEDVGINVGDRTFFLRSSPGSPFPSIFQRDPNNNESLFLDVHLALSSLPLASLEGVQINPDRKRVLLLVRPAPSLQRTIVIINTATGDKQSLAVDAIVHAQWLEGDTVGITTNRNGLPALLYSSSCTPVCSAPKLLYEEKDPSAAISITGQSKSSYAFLLSESPKNSKILAISREEASTQEVYPLSRDLRSPLFGTPYEHGFISLEQDSNDIYQANYRPATKQRQQVGHSLFSLPPDAIPLEIQNQNGNLVITYRLNTKTGLAVFRANSHRLEPIPTPQHCTPRPSRSSGRNNLLIRYWCDSYFSPSSLYRYNLKTMALTRLRHTRTPQMLRAETLLINQRLPLTLLSPTKSNSPLPTLLIAYGAYGQTLTPAYEPWIVALLRNNFRIAIAHVRGGGYFGSSWHNDGREEKKGQSIEDLLQAATFLSKENFSSKLFLYGKSAGGMLVASAAQQAPKLFTAVLLDAPLLDVRRATTDTTLPLTARERQEWGDPFTNLEVDSTMKRYSPTERTTNGMLPSFYIRVGERDKLTPKEDVVHWLSKTTPYHDSPMYLRIVPDGTHTGAYNSYNQLEEDALLLTYLLQKRSEG